MTIVIIQSIILQSLDKFIFTSGDTKLSKAATACGSLIGL